MTKLRKLIFYSSAILAFVFSLSICASAQIESLSVVDNTVYATTQAENSRLYVAVYDDGLLSDVFFANTDENGCVKLPVEVLDDSLEYRLYLWDKDSLAPVSVAYTLTNGRAYTENSNEAVPEYDFSSYSFNQEDDVMIVSSFGEGTITGYKAGVETTYNLTDKVTVLGLSDSVEDVVPGSVVLVGTNTVGDCAALELLATIGIPINPATFESHFGFYNPADGSEKYQNFVTELFSKSGSSMVFYHFDENGTKYIPTYINDKNKEVNLSYKFASANTLCYRVGIAMSGDVPVISYTSGIISSSGDDAIISRTDMYRHLLYLRYNTETERITQCVFYRIPKNYDWSQGDGEYSGIFSLEPKIIID